MNTCLRYFSQTLIWATLAQALSVAAAAGDPVLYHHHSAGASTFLKSSQGKTFQQVWSLPETEAFRKHVATNVARVIQSQIVSHVSSGAPDSSGVLTPLLEDLTQYESVLDIRGSAGKREWVLALKAPDARRQAWDAGLRNLLKNEKLPAPQAKRWGAASGNQVSFSASRLAWANAGEWLVVGWGPALPAIWDQTLKDIKSTQRPEPTLGGDTWLKLEADLAGLRSTFTEIPGFVDARLNLSLAGKGDNVRTDGKLTFPGNLGWSPEPWNLPTNTIHDPLVSFSAARGIAPLLRLSDDAKPFHLERYPNQACAWGMGMIPYLVYVAYPQTGVSNLLWQALPNIPTVISNYGKVVGQLMWVSNTTQVRWQGLPFATPIMRPAMDHQQEFLMAGLMPPYASKQLPPPELYSFLGRTNLAFYDWEITEERVLAWRRIVQAALIGFFREIPSTNTVSERLGETLSHGKRLGNSVTEVTVTKPNELTLMRQSPVGFTGMEIVHLLRWVDSPGFPFAYGRAPAADMKAEVLRQRALHPPGTAAPSLRPIPKRPGVTNAPAPSRNDGRKPALPAAKPAKSEPNN
ncbi:MAG: hypothetical protein HYR88_02340 [Verrucomicrobia bacterium]|nr:hypothetical protein [Verrucomicrobiota bacterium]MBI3870430.1 hypothetical protein [Verrucomicrobiota bacterium]